MDDSVCKKINALISLYIEGKLTADEEIMVEEHLVDCPECRDKYVQMKNVIKNLRFSYEHLLQEFEQIEEDNIFRVKEHDIFYANISSYIDNELSNNDAINFRKYLYKSKPARKDLEEAYLLENTLQKSFREYFENLKINYADNIIKQLKSERKETIGMNLKRMIFALGVLLVFTIAFFVYVTTAYNKQVSDTTNIEQQETVSSAQNNWEEEQNSTDSEVNSMEEQTSSPSESLADAQSPN